MDYQLLNVLNALNMDYGIMSHNKRVIGNKALPSSRYTKAIVIDFESYTLELYSSTYNGDTSYMNGIDKGQYTILQTRANGYNQYMVITEHGIVYNKSVD